MEVDLVIYHTAQERSAEHTAQRPPHRWKSCRGAQTCLREVHRADARDVSTDAASPDLGPPQLVCRAVLSPRKRVYVLPCWTSSLEIWGCGRRFVYRLHLTGLKISVPNETCELALRHIQRGYETNSLEWGHVADLSTPPTSPALTVLQHCIWKTKRRTSTSGRVTVYCDTFL